MNKLLLILCIALGVAGCDSVKPTTESIKSSYQQAASDTVIYTNVVQVLQNLRRDLPADIRLIVLQGRVLLVGYLLNSQEHVDIINAVWQIKGVQEVIDHLETVPINQKTGFELRNALIKTQLDAMFLANKSVHYGHFQYMVFKKNLYVLARAKSESEKESFFQMVRKVPSIQKVFFYNTQRQ